jgi:hypothetical protein
MNALAVVQALRSRADVPDVTHDPHLMHGLLLLNEERISEHTLGLAIGCSTPQVRAMLANARAGNLRKLSGWMGENYRLPPVGPSGASASYKPRNRKLRELFSTPWYRDAIEMMLRDGGLLTGDLEPVAQLHDLNSSTHKMVGRLRGALASEGFTVTVEPYARKLEARFTLVGKEAERMRSIIKANWFEVAR